MANKKITAPPNPATAKERRLRELSDKSNRRTPAESNELLDLLVAQLVVRRT